MKAIQFLFTLLLVLVLLPSAWGWPAVYKEGVTVSEPAKYFKGYTLFPPQDLDAFAENPNSAYSKKGVVYLVDMQGRVVHHWNTPGLAFQAKLLPDGHLAALTLCEKWSDPALKYIVFTPCLYEFTWDGRIVFEYKDPEMSHNFQKMASGNYFIIAAEIIPDAVAKRVRGGMKNTEYRGKMFGGVIKEINLQGKIVWTWHHYQHVDYNKDIIYPFFMRQELSHFNSIQVLPGDRLLLSSRSTSQVFLIDRITGKIIQRYGSPMYYDPRSKTIEYRDVPYGLGAQHSCSLLNERTLLCFNNGVDKGLTRSMEIDMPTNTVNWAFPVTEQRADFCYFMGGTQRLPNGNTLIAYSQADLIDEVARDGHIVWQYVIPKKLMRKNDMMFTATRYSMDYCPQFKRFK